MHVGDWIHFFKCNMNSFARLALGAARLTRHYLTNVIKMCDAICRPQPKSYFVICSLYFTDMFFLSGSWCEFLLITCNAAPAICGLNIVVKTWNDFRKSYGFNSFLFARYIVASESISMENTSYNDPCIYRGSILYIARFIYVIIDKHRHEQKHISITCVTNIEIYIYIYIHKYIHTYIHTYIHSYIYIYVQISDNHAIWIPVRITMWLYVAQGMNRSNIFFYDCLQWEHALKNKRPTNNISASSTVSRSFVIAWAGKSHK